MVRYEGGKPRLLLTASLVLAVLVAALALLVGVASAQEGSQDVPRAQPQASQAKIPDTYIVVFEEGVRDPAALANEHARAYGLRLRFRYQHAIEGYAAVFPNDRALQRVRSDPRVDYVEQDGVATVFAQTLPWGIDKIDADASSTLAGNGSGAVSNVNAYIIDTGVDASHADLNVVEHVNFANDGKNYDCHGHGTHVAGTVAARDNARAVVGVAPGAPITGVKVLGCDGYGSWSGIIAGVDWVTGHAVKPAVANMSLGGAPGTALDEAVVNSANSGVFYSISAGNKGLDACNYSPARAGKGTNNGIATTAATDSRDREASFSNYGNCVDIWAPGVNILSTKMGGGTTTFSGTSMAAPHVGGGGALYLSRNTSVSPSDVESQLKDAATVTAKKSKDSRIIVREYVKTF